MVVERSLESVEFQKVLGFYPELDERDVQLDEGSRVLLAAKKISSSVLGCVGKIGDSYFLGYDSRAFTDSLGKFKDSAFRGCVAHELSHVALGHTEEDYVNPDFNSVSKRFLDSFCEVFSIKYNIGNGREKLTDDDAIKRGFVNDLLKCKKRFPLVNFNGYTTKQLRRILSKQNGK